MRQRHLASCDGDVMSDWEEDPSEFFIGATRRVAGEHHEIVMDTNVITRTTSLEVRVDGGSGYETYTATSTIPIDLLIRLIERSGYTVTRG
jgi:hypothetical protein